MEQVKLGFEPTYKELKQQEKEEEEEDKRCFEPTYKELKLERFCLLASVMLKF